MPARLTWTALLVLFWFGLSDDASTGEVIASVAVTLAVLAAYAVLRKHASVPTGARPRWAWQALRAWPLKIVRDTGVALATVVRRKSPAGRLRQVDVGDASEIDLAWTIVGTSIAPLAYVVGIDERRRKLLVHELAATEQPEHELVWRPR
jgi:multisubunit Na+/H+ antiporter MnhE subunit